MNDYLSLNIKLQKGLVRIHQKINKSNICWLAIIIAIGGLDMYLHSNFGLGVMVMCGIFSIFNLLENHIEKRQAQELLQFYEQQDFKETQDRVLEGYERSKQNYENLIMQLSGQKECQ